MSALQIRLKLPSPRIKGEKGALRSPYARANFTANYDNTTYVKAAIADDNDNDERTHRP